MKNYKRLYRIQKEMREHYQTMCESAIGELHYEKTNVGYLYNVLDEIEAMTNDPLAKAVIKNAKERHNLDKIIHTRLIFGNEAKKL